MIPYLLAFGSFGVLVLLPRRWWSVGVCFVGASLGILFSSAPSQPVLHHASAAPFWIANGALAAGLYHMVRRAMAPDAAIGPVMLWTVVAFGVFGLTFGLILIVLNF